MSKRIAFSALLAMAILLVPGTSHARYLNANTGRFQTMDTYAGNNEDPLSLHKYLYAQDNPGNRIDPSGHDPAFTLPGFSVVSSIAATLDAIDLSVTFRAFSWATFRVVTAAIAIGAVETGDNGGSQMLFHYDTPGNFDFVAEEFLEVKGEIVAVLGRVSQSGHLFDGLELCALPVPHVEIDFEKQPGNYHLLLTPQRARLTGTQPPPHYDSVVGGGYPEFRGYAKSIRTRDAVTVLQSA